MFSWRHLGPGGDELGRSGPFHSLEEAESWLEQRWHRLREDGANSVELIEQDGGRSVYSMSLLEAGE